MERERRAARVRRVPAPPLVRIGLGEGGGAPLPSISRLSPSRILFQLGKGGILLPVGVGLLLARPPPGRPQPPLDPLYTGAGGTPRHTS